MFGTQEKLDSFVGCNDCFCFILVSDSQCDGQPKAKKDLGPLLDAIGSPLFQIVSGVGLLLGGVLNLVSRLLSGLGLDGLLSGLAG